MSSDDIPGTSPRCNACPPGEGRCFRERSSSLANAYALGCRSPDATRANSDKARERRARVRSERSSGSLPDAWADPEDLPERQPTGETCECGSPLYWETGRGASVCDNGHWNHAPGTESRVIGESKSRELELADSGKPVSLMPERAARARLRALRETAEQWLAEWIDTLGNPDCYDTDGWKREAIQLAALLRGFIPELRDAESERELSEIKQYITSNEVLASQAGRNLLNEYRQAQLRMQLAERRELERGEEPDYEDEDEDEDEDETVTGRVIETTPRLPALATPASIAKQQSRAQVTDWTRPGSRATPANGVTIAVAMMYMRQVKKDKELAEKGECGIKHRFGKAVASRLYGVPHRINGQMSGYALPNTPQYRACPQHYDAIERQLHNEGYEDTCYWELPLTDIVQNRSSWGSGW